MTVASSDLESRLHAHDARFGNVLLKGKFNSFYENMLHSLRFFLCEFVAVVRVFILLFGVVFGMFLYEHYTGDNIGLRTTLHYLGQSVNDLVGVTGLGS